MKKVHVRGRTVGVLAASTLIAAGALAAAGTMSTPAGWAPVTYGLTESPEQLLPATVSADQPARVVTTTVDRTGRPVVSVQEAATRTNAAELIRDGQAAKDAVSVEVDAPVYALGIPAGPDSLRGQQWDFAKLKIAEAWKKSTGAGVTVAVIDSGVDASHPDLGANVLTGYDAITNRAGVTTDANGHGTHVAGTIAAITGNNAGVSAIAPDTKILPVKVLGANGSGNMSDAAEGIIWSADHGAQVINLSLGSTTKVNAVTNAINYARSRGVTVVAAAGNARTSGNPVSYPAADAGVIAVAATDSGDKYGSYSSAGAYVDVAAPGSSIVSTYPAALGSAYRSMSGTSMASPHVAAVAALLKSANPALTPDQIEAALERTAVDLGAKGFDNDYGNGRIDPVAALASVGGATTAPPTAAPTSSVPATNAPATTAPTTRAPATSAPITTAPTTRAPATAPSTTAPSGPTRDTAVYEAQVVTLTNEQRAANGCGALRVDDRLTAAARAHSTDMVEKGFFSHTSSDGSDFVARATRAGYTGASAENIAYGYPTAQEVVTGWMNSAGHRANILNCKSVAVGVGLVVKADGTAYWTQDFGRI